MLTKSDDRGGEVVRSMYFDSQDKKQAEGVEQGITVSIDSRSIVDQY